MRFNNSPSSQDKYGYEEFSRFLRCESPTCQSHSVGTHQNETHGEKSLAMVYPVKQKFIKIYDPEIALVNGTMFEELFMPFNRASCRSASNKGEGC